MKSSVPYGDPVGTILESFSARFEAFEWTIIYLIKPMKTLSLFLTTYPL